MMKVGCRYGSEKNIGVNPFMTKLTKKPAISDIAKLSANFGILNLESRCKFLTYRMVYLYSVYY